MKNKLLALVLVLTTVFSVLAGLCFAVKADSPNLLEMYGYNPHFDDGVAPWKTDTSATIEQCDEDSADDDGYCAKITSRSKVNFANLRLSEDYALSIFQDQGAGTYYYSFWVRCLKSGSSIRLSPAFQLVYGGNWSTEASQKGEVVGKWPSDPDRKGILVTDKWTKIEIEIDVELSVNGKDLYQAIIYSIQRDHSSDNAPDLLFDDVTLIKRGSYVEVTPIPKVEVPSQKRVNEVNRSEKTGIGAINYNMWFETYENWWETTNEEAARRDCNSVQEARGLSPAKYHFHLPFFATVNTSITSSNKINGDISAGVAEFPEYTVDVWKKEMEYAVESGIDFMAYLWNYKKRPGRFSYEYHIQTKGLDGKLKMCAILQSEAQDLNTMATAMCEDYWYTIDGMPVVYIYDAKDAGTEEFISIIRKKLAVAQYVKNGEVGAPAYIIAMVPNSYSTAVGITSRGFDAVGWYAVGASSAATDEQKKNWDADGTKIRTVTFKALAESGLKIMKDISKVAKQGYASVTPVITLGYDTTARIDNPVTWITGQGSLNNLPYSGYTAALPTTEEVTQNVVDVLNFNKENAKYFRANTVLIYAWNEFNEGGWFCPTLACDEEGNVLKNADGTNKINREYLDAVKKGIELYREHEAESAIYDVDGTKIKDIDMSLSTSEPAKTEQPLATATPQPLDDEVKENNNGWVLWVIIGGAVVVAAAAVVVVIVLKKKKANAQTEESAE